MFRRHPADLATLKLLTKMDISMNRRSTTGLVVYLELQAFVWKLCSLLNMAPLLELTIVRSLCTEYYARNITTSKYRRPRDVASVAV